MASDFTQEGKLRVANQTIDLITDNIKVMLVKSSYVHSKNRSFVDDGTANDAASHELTVSGYVGGFGGAGRKSLTTKALARDDPNATIKYTHDSVVWVALASGETIGGVVGIKEGTNDADSVVVFFDDLLANVATNGGDITWNPDANGTLQF